MSAPTTPTSQTPPAAPAPTPATPRPGAPAGAAPGRARRGRRCPRRHLARAGRAGPAPDRARRPGHRRVGGPDLAGAQRRPGRVPHDARGRPADVGRGPAPPRPVDDRLRRARRRCSRRRRCCATPAGSSRWPCSSASSWPPPAPPGPAPCCRCRSASWRGRCPALRGLPLLGRTITATSKVSKLWPILRTIGLLAGGAGPVRRPVRLRRRPVRLVGRGPDPRPRLGHHRRAHLRAGPGGRGRAGRRLPRPEPAAGRRGHPAGEPPGRAPLGVGACPWASSSRCSPASSSRRPRRCGAVTTTCERTTGLTYAEYVHQGFGQLTVATFLTVVVVGLTMHVAAARHRARPGAAAGAARRPVRAHPRGRRQCALPDVAVPGRLRLHRAARVRRRLRAVARPGRRVPPRRRGAPVGLVGAARGARLGRRLRARSSPR